MKIIYLFLAFFYLNTLAAQTVLTYYYDQNWQPVSSVSEAEYIRKATSGDLFFTVEDAYANGKPAAKGQYKSILDVKKTSGQTSQVGKFTWFYSDGKEQKCCNYATGKLEGNYIENFPTGKTKLQRTYKLGEIVAEKVFSEDNNPITAFDRTQNWFIFFDTKGNDTLCAKATTPARFVAPSCTMTNGGALTACCERNFNTYLATQNKTEGLKTKVLVRFKINANGEVSKVSLVEADKNAHANTEALRLISALPPFTPAEEGGKKVAVLMEKLVEIE